MPDTTERPLRLCQACGGLDDHPRHTIDGVKDNVGAVSKEFLKALPDGLPATAIAEAITGNVLVRHLDCCAAACLQCQATEKVTKGARGQKLRAALDAGALADFVAPEITDNAQLGVPTKEENADG